MILIYLLYTGLSRWSFSFISLLRRGAQSPCGDSCRGFYSNISLTAVGESPCGDSCRSLWFTMMGLLAI